LYFGCAAGCAEWLCLSEGKSISSGLRPSVRDLKTGVAQKVFGAVRKGGAIPHIGRHSREFESLSMTTEKITIHCTVNGTAHALRAYPMARLLDVLREELRLTGTKEGCGEGECGACSVLVNGELVNSCLVPVAQVSNAEITTIEGIASDNQLHAVQQAFLTHGGAQCGICTPGMVLAAVSLLERNPNPTEAEIRTGLAGNLCRCTGYMKIFTAVVQACQR
jgi:aerobic carbon-monoxide dehydrogenase small subunit